MILKSPSSYLNHTIIVMTEETLVSDQWKLHKNSKLKKNKWLQAAKICVNDANVFVWVILIVLIDKCSLNTASFKGLQYIKKKIPRGTTLISTDVIQIAAVFHQHHLDHENDATRIRKGHFLTTVLIHAPISPSHKLEVFLYVITSFRDQTFIFSTLGCVLCWFSSYHTAPPSNYCTFEILQIDIKMQIPGTKKSCTCS